VEAFSESSGRGIALGKMGDLPHGTQASQANAPSKNFSVHAEMYKSCARNVRPGRQLGRLGMAPHLLPMRGRATRARRADCLGHAIDYLQAPFATFAKIEPPSQGGNTSSNIVEDTNGSCWLSSATHRRYHRRRSTARTSSARVRSSRIARSQLGRRAAVGAAAWRAGPLCVSSESPRRGAP